jgi:hypothetical protein
MKWVWLLVVGCSAPAHVDAPARHEARCVAMASAGPHEIVGRVTDRDGRPLAGVRIAEAAWTKRDDRWQRSAGASTTTTTDGTYRMSVPQHDAMLVFERDRRRVVWGHVSTPRRIDVEIDGKAAPGVVAMFDGRLGGGDPCARWQCSIDREPEAEWWTRPLPCPDGGTLRFEIAPDIAFRSGASVRCELDGTPHGATTTWLLLENAWTEESGWFEHGKRCGMWREPPVLERPGTEHQP